jgi:hypothetical protein
MRASSVQSVFLAQLEFALPMLKMGNLLTCSFFPYAGLTEEVSI